MAEHSKIEWTNHIDLNATGRVLGAYKTAAARTGATLQEWMTKRSNGEKWCFRCRGWKPGIDFSTDVSRFGGKASSCKACTSEASTASRYRMTRKELKKFRDDHGHRCGICSSGTNIVIDHDHNTGRVRGTLCQNCNSALGKFKESRALLMMALLYLERISNG